MRRRNNRPVQAAVKNTIMAAAAAAMLSTAANGASREWIGFDNQPAGTAPSITLLTEQSSATESVFEVKVHGMWLTAMDVPGQDGPMHALELPGTGAMATDALGLPELPGVALNVACTVGGVQGEPPNVDIQVTPMSQVELSGIRVYPRQANDATDETGGDGDQTFYYNESFYQTSDDPFPTAAARALGGYRKVRGIGSIGTVVTCLRCQPATERLLVETAFLVRVQMTGSPLEHLSIRPSRATFLGEMYHNASLLWELQLATLNLGADEGDYLIVTPDQYRDELLPLIRQKTERGLRVRVIITSSLGTGFDAADVKAAIADWYDTCDNHDECYVLLIGDLDEMPMHEDPLNDLPSDHYYVCLNDELEPDCPIGRYSCDSETDLAQQIAKTIAYSENPIAGSEHYSRGLLAAHKQQSKEYVECIEDIEDQVYLALQPEFTMYSGRETGSTVANVVDDINNTHYGLVMYRGHGWKIKWGDNWNTQNDELWDTDVAGLSNGAYTPIVVSVACGNSAMQLEDDCIGEVWMERDEHGAVAHIGSTRSSKTVPNHDFARMFQYFYWTDSNFALGLLMQGSWEFAWLSNGCSDDAAKNIYMCQLLGDPELRPWIHAPIGLSIIDMPVFHEGFHLYSVNVAADRALDLDDVIVVAVVNGEIRQMARCDESGRADLELNLEQQDEVVLRAHTELAFALDTRRESVVAASCPADLDGSGAVDIDDLLAVVGGWNTVEGDITGDGTTDIEDVLAVLDGFGECP
ncbi:MAG: C25 family cysteine peptidase [Phycisphaerales bacterium]|jgi:hypothetical protein|nr:C25 family cysteine peptidase [Phycisphaerales bacterium]